MTPDEWGRLLVGSEEAIDLLFRGCKLTDLHILPSIEVEEYNAACIKHDKLNVLINAIEQPTLTPEQDAAKRQRTWFIPEAYQQTDIRNLLLSFCDRADEIARVNLEMDMFEERGLVPVLRLMHFLVEHWRSQGVVWGVGRGSSVASYCLFLLGVHKLDALHYNFDIKEFLK